MPQEPVKEVLGLLVKEGDQPYPGERMTILEHSLRTAFLAEESKAPSYEVAAALLHNVGYLLDCESEGATERDGGSTRGDVTSDYLRRWFGDSVIEPIRLQAAAKRYLCATEPGYVSQLSESSAKLLAMQGGPMSAPDAEVFLKSSHAEAAVRLRRLHDRAKSDGSSAPELDHFVPHLDAATVVIDRLSPSQII